MKNIIVSLLLSIIVVVVLSESGEKKIITSNLSISENGVIFEKQGNIDFITASHNLVISLDSRSIIKAGNELLRIMNDSKEMVKNSDHYLKDYYLTTLSGLMKRFSDAVEKYENFINNTNYNDNFDLDNILNEIDKNRGDSTSEIDLINSYISNVNISYTNTSKIKNAISRANLIYKTLNAHYNEPLSQLANSSTELIMTFSISFFEFCVRDFNEEIKQLFYRLNSILTSGKNSIFIITPKYFMNVLQKLQNDLHLIYPPTDKFISKYYSICSSSVRKKNQILYFIIKIPIKSAYKFQLFKVHYLSIPIGNLPGWTRGLNNAPDTNYFAISNDGGQYVTLQNSCVLSTSKICNSVQQIQRTSIDGENHCLLSAYLNQAYKNNDNNCNFIYQYNDKSNFQIVESFWIGAILKNEMQINKVCLDDGQQYTFKVKRGIVQIPISNNCSYIGETFILPASEMRVNVVADIKEILVPLNVNFSDLIISKLFAKDSGLKYLTSHDINTFKILSKEKRENSFMNSEVNLTFFISAVIYMIVVTGALIIYLRLKIIRRTSNDNTLPTPPSTPLLPPPPPPLLFEEKNQHSRQVLNQQYFCPQPPEAAVPFPRLPPPPTPIYEECRGEDATYIDMQQNYGRK